MGELNVRLASNKRETQLFVKQLLKDVKALERMIDEDWFETDVVRIGAEQELCLVDRHCKPAPINLEVIDAIGDELVTSELARFNLEYNLDPQVFEGDALARMEAQIRELYAKVLHQAEAMGAEPVLVGILPTIRKFDVSLENLTPLDRYRALMDALNQLRADDLELKIRGIDELRVKHDSPLLEGCNTGFQVHLQVNPDEFAELYNIAQLLTAPVLAVSAFSPMLFGKRLWFETRVALFQQSIDTRTTSEYLRTQSPRVMFGHQWLKDTILEIYREDIARHRVLLSADLDEDVFRLMKEGVTPKLRALSVHNGTVYRWNRPCYGVSPNGKPHLRIENRILPAGPTIIDEMASAALWLGLMRGVQRHYGNPSRHMAFEEVGHNFLAAARTGINSKFSWFGAKQIGVAELVAKELVPLAREGLAQQRIDTADIDRYMDLILERVETHQTGAQWMLNSFTALQKERRSQEDILRNITAAMITNQQADLPVHRWPLAAEDEKRDWEPDRLLVEEIMTTDLFTVQRDDILALVAEMMDWNRIRYVPVEDERGELIGLVTSRILLRYFSRKHLENDRRKPLTVGSVMITNPITAAPEDSIIGVLDTMMSRQIGCVPVIKGRKLVGIVTQADFVSITDAMIKRFARRNAGPGPSAQSR
jgi:CBS domain-containing protein/gamma-glutamyl:cysteine ligase YbdK (ATP-grasp superfamily)